MAKESRRSGAFNQYYATVCVNLISTAYGASCVWTSPSLPILESKDTPLPSGPITKEQSSWIGSILCIGGIVGVYLYGWITNKYGRKIPTCTTVIPMLAALFLIIYGTNVNHLILSRFLVGFAGGGLYISIPQYTVEIAEDKIRGALGSMVNFSRNFGYLVGYILGNFLTYEIFPWALATIPVVFFFGFVFLPETPRYLMQKGKMKAAEKSLRYFRGYRSKDEVSIEFTKELTKIESNTLMERNSKNVSLVYQDFTTRAAKKSILISLSLIALREFSGLFAMLTYSATIFMEAGSTLTPNMSSIVIGVIQVVGSYASTLLVDKAGRRALLLISSLGMFVALGCMSAFLYLKSINYDVTAVSWIPLACFSAVIFIGNIGISSLPYVVIIEVLPVKIKNVMLTIFMSLSFSMSFISLKALAPLILYFGMHGLFLVYAIATLAGALFVIFVLPETKGKSLEAIEELLGR